MMKQLEELKIENKKVIVFDMDGTLIDSIGIWNITDYELIKRLAQIDIELHVIQQERDSFLENHAGEDIYLAYCHYLKVKYNFNLEDQAILDLRWKISNDYLRVQVDYKKNADVLLNRLKQMGKKLALATVTTQVQLDIYEKENKNIMSKANILETFNYILSKESLIHKKPHPEIYLKILEEFKIKPEQCLVFEDSYLGVLAAKNAEIEVVNIYDDYAQIDRNKIDEITDYKIAHYQEFLEFL